MIHEVVRSFSRSLDYLRRLLADVPDNQWARQPGGVANHPAWVIGHLVHSCQAIGVELGVEPWLADDWRRRFGTGSVPVGNRDEYPDRDELIGALAAAESRIVDRLAEIGEAELGQPLPDVRYRVEFPTLGHAVLHILTAHTAIHVGQVSAWRRAMGFPPLSEPFI